jgi:hypothetical protein
LCISAYLKTFAQTERSFLWHSGVAQPGKKSGFEKRADGCHREKSGGLQAGDARITIVTTQPSDFGEFEGRPFGVSFKRVGGGEPGMMGWGCRIGAVPSFEPADRLVDPRLRQMRLPNPVVP